MSLCQFLGKHGFSLFSHSHNVGHVVFLFLGNPCVYWSEITVSSGTTSLCGSSAILVQYWVILTWVRFVYECQEECGSLYNLGWSWQGSPNIMGNIAVLIAVDLKS